MESGEAFVLSEVSAVGLTAVTMQHFYKCTSIYFSRTEMMAETDSKIQKRPTNSGRAGCVVPISSHSGTWIAFANDFRNGRGSWWSSNRAGCRRHSPIYPSRDNGAALGKHFPENRTMTPFLVLAIATYGKAGLMRQGCEKIEESGCFRLIHLCAEFALEGIP